MLGMGVLSNAQKDVCIYIFHIQYLYIYTYYYININLKKIEHKKKEIPTLQESIGIYRIVQMLL